jgi:prepilin-type N-terminal cleavage/methylation domain-containing protein
MERVLLKKDSGFTLIELMVIIAIIAILAVMATLSMDMIKRYAVSSATRQLLADVQNVRVNAMTVGPNTSIPQMRGGGIRFVNSRSYVTFKFNDCSQDFTYQIGGCGGSTREEAEAETRNVRSSLEILLSTGGSPVTPANAVSDILIFDRMGILRLGTDWSPAGTTVVIMRHTGIGYARCVTIGTSSVSEGAWNGSSCQ